MCLPQGTPARTVGFRDDADGGGGGGGGFDSPPSSRRVRSGGKKTGAFKSPGRRSRASESEDLSAYDGAVMAASL